MKKTSSEDDLLPEHDFNYTKAKPNRFALPQPQRTVAVFDEDLSKVFTPPESVTKALRAFIEAIPAKPDKDAAQQVAASTTYSCLASGLD